MSTERSLTNAELYVRWVNEHQIGDLDFSGDLRLAIQTIVDDKQLTGLLVTTRDREYVLDVLTDEIPNSNRSLYHFSLLSRRIFRTEDAAWEIVGTEFATPADLIERTRELPPGSVVIVEDILKLLRDRVAGSQLRSRIVASETAAKPILVFLESPEVVVRLPEDSISSLMRLHVRLVDRPDEHGFFHRGKQYCLLPFLRAYWKNESANDGETNNPVLMGSEWTKVTKHQERKAPKKSSKTRKPSKIIGWTRFLRADQVLDWISDTLPEHTSHEKLSVAINRAMRSWLVAFKSDDPLVEHLGILDRRIETIKVKPAKGTIWSSSLSLPARNVKNFPNELRWPVAGLDPVHTPESAHAGLTRYINEGWRIDERGALIHGNSASVFGPSASRIPHAFCDEPRRLMLGSSLQARAVDLEDSLGKDPKPRDRVQIPGWYPPGANLRAAFSTCKGWTHEDAIVLSRTAARKLRKRWQIKEWTIMIPAIASRIEVQIVENSSVERGQRLVRAYIDLFALGLRGHEAEKIKSTWDQGEQEGWLEIALPGAIAPLNGTVLEIKRASIADLVRESGEDIDTLYQQMIDRPRGADRQLKYREALTVIVEVHPDVSIGDKLSTRHGIKGVVSKIVEDNDEDLPNVAGQPAEIVFSPVGIARRKAMGQFREALSETDATEPPRAGVVFVMRQPQDAVERYSICGRKTDAARGQRYGEMEFWALMGHGARAIAKELLSSKRSTSPWLKWEGDIEANERDRLVMRAVNDGLPEFNSQIGNGDPTQVDSVEPHTESIDHQRLATRALNHYLAGFNIQIMNGDLARVDSVEAFSIRSGNYTELRDAWDLLNDSRRFAANGGLGVIEFESPLEIAIGGQSRPTTRLYVLPPWLRPATSEGTHNLTKAYQSLFKAMVFKKSDPKIHAKELRKRVQRCVNILLDSQIGLPSFLRREVLGRRLTRSARAVIVPQPDLRIDEIVLPKFIADKLFQGLPDKNQQLVLVNRNPTLHRLGLLALRPLIDDSNAPVFRLPLGVLKVLGADFDGDQATVVALETEEALADAQKLLPGSFELRADQFRRRIPALPLLQELGFPEAESELALNTGYSQEEWCDAHRALVRSRINEQDGWPADLMEQYLNQNERFWHGLSQEEWLQLADVTMGSVYLGVRKKARYGGVLRRELYRREYRDDQSFFRAVAALQAITERLTQSALTTKIGEGAAAFKYEKYFMDSRAEGSRTSLALLEPENPTLDADLLADALGTRSEPAGLLALLSNPSGEGLLHVLESLEGPDNVTRKKDLRIHWFLS
ncbi:MAG: hypothetical protein QOH70_1955 [Blastocatellia bacterium]|jgi:hypothetical protein|nr:hypothetical protein [Blastocatellia bacterium]